MKAKKSTYWFEFDIANVQHSREHSKKSVKISKYKISMYAYIREKIQAYSYHRSIAHRSRTRKKFRLNKYEYIEDIQYLAERKSWFDKILRNI